MCLILSSSSSTGYTSCISGVKIKEIKLTILTVIETYKVILIVNQIKRCVLESFEKCPYLMVYAVLNNSYKPLCNTLYIIIECCKSRINETWFQPKLVTVGTDCVFNCLPFQPIAIKHMAILIANEL